MSLAKPETNDDGQLPTGWHLLTCWHFTAGRFNCRTSAALPTSQQNPERERTFVRVLRETERIAFAFPRAWEILRWYSLICRALLPVEDASSALPIWIRTCAGAIRSLK